MENLSSIANTRGRGSRLYRGLIAEDATGPNDTVPVRIPSYEPARQFGPCHWFPRTLADGTLLFPIRNDGCLVALDENDQAEIVNWWSDDPTEPPTVRFQEFGPYLADPGGDIASGAEAFIPMFHGIPGLPADPRALCVIQGHVLDGGHDASHCSWRADIDQTAVYIAIANNRASGTAYPKVRFTIKVKVP
jgi:hypothetical protein